MFENTLRLVDEADLIYLHVFPFSARHGTPAARMPQLRRELIRERASRLRKKGAAQLEKRLLQLVGTKQSLLVEEDGRGHTECFASARFAEAASAGSLVSARVTGACGDHVTVQLLT